MNMHKNTRLTPHHRQAIWLAYTQGKESIDKLPRNTEVGFGISYEDNKHLYAYKSFSFNKH